MNEQGARTSISVVMTGSGGSGVITAGNMLLDAAGAAGWYGLMTRSSGPQIRGGEAAALLRLSTTPVDAHDDSFHILAALDWENVQRFAAEIALTPESLILADPAAGAIPEAIAAKGARVARFPLKEMARKIPEGRVNMVALGAVAQLVGLQEDAVLGVVERSLKKGKKSALAASTAAIRAGMEAARTISGSAPLAAHGHADPKRWTISGNEAAGLGALKGGVRFVAAYPITPATEILEWIAPALRDVGGLLVQAEDELASINMAIGASFGGTPSLTATSGPGLALMSESLGLAVASETPIVVIDVMRGGPSTGIPTKSEQSDLNIAVYGLHGDAPHLVLAPTSVADCVFTTQWAVHLAEKLQAPAIVLSDQFLGQQRAIINAPAPAAFIAQRSIAREPKPGYQRYAATADGVSPMALPGTPHGQYTADGLEHNARGTPSSQAQDHLLQLDKRRDKLALHDYGAHWADVEGDGDVAILTWGSTAGPAREALARARRQGVSVRLITPRLLLPVQPARMAAALQGVRRVIVLEQSHSGQFLQYLRAHYDLTAELRSCCRAGPLLFKPAEIVSQLADWVQ